MMRTPESDFVSQVFFSLRRWFVWRIKYIWLLLFHITLIPPGEFYLFYQESHVGSSARDWIWFWSAAKFSRGNVWLCLYDSQLHTGKTECVSWVELGSHQEPIQALEGSSPPLFHRLVRFCHSSGSWRPHTMRGAWLAGICCPVFVLFWTSGLCTSRL